MNREILIFEISGAFFSMPLDSVEEVVPSSSVTRVPNSPPFLLGLAAIRGKIVGVIDAARRYGVGPGLNSHFMVCKVRGNLTAVAIDRPLVAGSVPVRELSPNEYLNHLNTSKVDRKFLKAGFELLEVEAEGAPPKPTGTFFSEVDADLFVSNEMASKVGEV
jgi:chemotaxis signal transduction protein